MAPGARILLLVVLAAMLGGGAFIAGRASRQDTHAPRAVSIKRPAAPKAAPPLLGAASSLPPLRPGKHPRSAAPSGGDSGTTALASPATGSAGSSSTGSSAPTQGSSSASPSPTPTPPPPPAPD